MLDVQICSMATRFFYETLFTEISNACSCVFVSVDIAMVREKIPVTVKMLQNKQILAVRELTGEANELSAMVLQHENAKITEIDATHRVLAALIQ